jgi:mRNA-degrading endonuclease RelE of RelBE toxin-antitoxin system
MLFVESSGFTRSLPEFLDDQEYALLQARLVLCPASGSLIPGTGGLRKLRWRRLGMGKRGGLRVIYYWWARRDTIYLLSIYAKSRTSELTAKDKKLLSKFVEEFVGHDQEQ